jgi:hypothetical protein
MHQSVSSDPTTFERGTECHACGESLAGWGDLVDHVHDVHDAEIHRFYRGFIESPTA